ncbi:hypothetical protein AB836_00315 [Rickettsiales bacterium (ex Bugula neritina AB1)]|nr:hypothetical protein AB836_00315 [Rickettsiales bacterium (ex Bugula neritina AB1)]
MSENKTNYQILVDKLSFDNFVCKLIIKEELSQATYINMTTMVYSEENIPILLIEEELLKSIVITAKIDDTNKKIYNGKIFNYTKHQNFVEISKTLQWCVSFDIYHHLYSLNYFCPYRIFQKTTLYDVIYEVLVDSETQMAGNSDLLKKIKINTLVQFGENSLHFLKRLLQMHGYYFICDAKENIIYIYNTVIGYKKSEKKYYLGNVHNSYIDLIHKVNINRKTTYKEYYVKNIDIVSPDKPLENVVVSDKGIGAYKKYPVYFSNDEEGHNYGEAIRSKNEHDNESMEIISYIFKGEAGLLIEGEVFLEPNVITSIEHIFELPNYAKNTPYYYVNKFKTIAGDKVFVSSEKLERPLINGLLPAKVITPEEEKVYRNELGYIKVQFKWNMNMEKDMEMISDKDVGWVPLANSLSSNEFGSYITPRKDDEVLISFIGGNPDIPVVVGSMYTEVFKNFYGLENDKSKFAFKSKSLTDTYMGSTSIYIDDQENNEKVFLEAQKDMEISVGKREEVENNYTFTMLKGKREEKILEGDYTLDLTNGDYSRTIHGSESTVIIKGDKGGDYSLKITEGKLTIEVNGDTDIDITGNGKIHIAKECDIEIVGKTKIMTSDSLEVISNLDMSIHSDTKISMTAPEIDIIADASFSLEASDKGSIKAINDVKIDAGSLKCMAMMDINMEATGDYKTKSGAVTSLESGMDLSLVAGMCIKMSSGLDISLDSGMNIAQKVGLKYSVDAGLEVGINAGLAMSLNCTSFATNSVLCRLDSAVPVILDFLISKGII